MPKQTIGEFLAALRKANGYTQQEVADKLGISNRTLSAWENNKAYPDILTLPAIAEIYGVTTDEILRGERLQTGDSTGATAELSQKAQEGIYKNILAKTAVRNTVLAGCGIGCAALVLLMSFVGNFAPNWLCVLLLIISLGGMGAVCVLFIVFDKSSLACAGIYIGDELSPEQSKFVFALRRAALKNLRLIGLCWLFCGIAETIVFAAIYDMQLTYLGWSLLIILPVGALMLVVCFALFSREVYSHGTQDMKAARKSNGELLFKCVGFAAIPVVLAAAAFLAFGGYCEYRFTDEYSAEREEFLHYMHTFTVPDELVGKYGIETDMYYADISSVAAEWFIDGEIHDIGGGFYIRIYLDYADVYYKTDYEDYLILLSAQQVTVDYSDGESLEDEFIYNLRGGTVSWLYEDYDRTVWFGIGNYGGQYQVVADNGVYTLRYGLGYDYSGIITPLCVIVGAAGIAAGCAVYIFKRKKMPAK